MTILISSRFFSIHVLEVICSIKMTENLQNIAIMNDCDSDSDFDMEAAAEKSLSTLLPEKSKEKYEKQYEIFKKWCNDKKATVVNETVLLAYFSSDEMVKFKSSTLWSIYSMLKLTLNVKDNIDVCTYNQLRALLKRKGDGYVARKSRIFTMENIYKYIKDAPDVDVLVIKVNFKIKFR